MFNHKRVVTVLPKRLGDAIFITPALAFIKKHNPDCHLTVIALSNLAAEVVANNPAVDAVLMQPEGEFAVALQLHHNSQVAAVIADVPAEKYIMPVHATANPKADHSLAYLAQLMQKPVDEKDRHYHLYPQASDDSYVENLLSKLGVDSASPIIGMHIGCHGIAKKRWRFWKKLTHERVWPLENFIALAKSLEQQYPQVRFIVTGSQAESRLASVFCKKVKSAVNLTSQTNILQLAALMKQLRLFITPDTGALHVACAMDCMSVSLFLHQHYAPSQPYPSGDRHCSLQAGSISTISVDAVCEAVKGLL